MVRTRVSGFVTRLRKNADISLLNNEYSNMRQVYQALPNGTGITGKYFNETDLLNGSGGDISTKWELATTKKSDGTGDDLADKSFGKTIEVSKLSSVRHSHSGKPICI